MSNLNEDPKEWLEKLFEDSYCEECGGDTIHHDAIPFVEYWFARCKYPRRKDGSYHPIIKKYRKDREND